MDKLIVNTFSLYCNFLVIRLDLKKKEGLYLQRLERSLRKKKTMADHNIEHIASPDDVSNVCCICLEDLYPSDIVGLLFHCRHFTFHLACIQQWLTSNTTCPMCRTGTTRWTHSGLFHMMHATTCNDAAELSNDREAVMTLSHQLFDVPATDIDLDDEVIVMNDLYLSHDLSDVTTTTSGLEDELIIVDENPDNDVSIHTLVSNDDVVEMMYEIRVDGEMFITIL